MLLHLLQISLVSWRLLWIVLHCLVATTSNRIWIKVILVEQCRGECLCDASVPLGSLTLMKSDLDNPQPLQLVQLLAHHTRLLVCRMLLVDNLTPLPLDLYRCHRSRVKGVQHIISHVTTAQLTECIIVFNKQQHNTAWQSCFLQVMKQGRKMYRPIRRARRTL